MTALTQENAMIRCQDCKWAKRGGWFKPWEFARCTHPTSWKKATISPVTGRVDRFDQGEFGYCSTARLSTFEGKCGPDATHFERRRGGTK